MAVQGPTATDVEIVIIGAGFSGLLAASYLKEAGFTSLRLFEKSPSVGGVWAHGGVGAYPGAACDVPAYTYLPFLDRTGFIPSKKYVSQREIADYAELLTDHCGLREFMGFSREVADVRLLDDGSGRWQVTTLDPATREVADIVTCTHVIAANGPLSSPRLPEVPGMASFRGESFHTAQWDRSASLAGKRVGVIGTGASAAQVITSIVDEVEHLTVFQRTPTWCLPRDDEPTPQEIIDAFRAGGYGEALRKVDWDGADTPADVPITFDDLHDPERNAAICEMIATRIREEVKDPALAAALTPDYPFFCKRALFIDDYYTTFNRDTVTLVDDPGGVVRIHEEGPEIARGERFAVDVLIYATGFDSNLIPFPVTGRDGVTLAEAFGASAANNWQMTRPHSLWGIHVPGMPNFHMMIGPQSLNPFTNVTLVCEEQARYLAGLLSEMRERGARTVEPTREAAEAWTKLCERSSDGKVWLKCNNWYMKTTKTDAAAGRERSSGMWMGSYPDYLRHLLGGEGGARDELLRFA
ncbi:MAG: NAD(P)/FAD-dependent oxidoreductase [Pseudomonadales bacterium]|jgi:cation diffusion facilitator CzcD-associated flavoprotein CzcO|nr:NAD(P)/FAD-dependent oxidoreductase [Pseudomonadales bacterium]